MSPKYGAESGGNGIHETALPGDCFFTDAGEDTLSPFPFRGVFGALVVGALLPFWFSLFVMSSGEMGGVGVKKYGDLAGAFFVFGGFDFGFAFGGPSSSTIASVVEFFKNRSDLKRFGGSIGVSLGVDLYSSSSMSCIFPGIPEVEYLRFARGLGTGTGVSFFGANVLSASRSREIVSMAEDPTEARRFAGAVTEFPFLGANFPCASLSSVCGAFSPVEACRLAGVASFLANLPCSSLTRDGVAEFDDVDILLALDFFTELDRAATEEGSFGANLPFESLDSELAFVFEFEAEAVEPRSLLGVTSLSS